MGFTPRAGTSSGYKASRAVSSRSEPNLILDRYRKMGKPVSSDHAVLAYSAALVSRYLVSRKAVSEESFYSVDATLGPWVAGLAYLPPSSGSSAWFAWIFSGFSFIFRYVLRSG